MKNSFSLTFGQIPSNYIERKKNLTRIVGDFTLSYPVSHLYIIQGVRGVGKTVLLSAVAKEFMKSDDWIIIDINAHRDILEQLASGLYESTPLKRLFLKKTLSFSFHGISFSIEGDEPISNIKTLCSKMLAAVSKQHKRVLLTIDEVSNSENIRSFAADFQSFLREEQPLFCLMTGLVENVTSLTGNEVVTFLQRAPKITLGPLSLSSCKEGFCSSLEINDEEAEELSSLSLGYPFAYQVLGLLYEEIGMINEQFLREFDSYLAGYVYDKIWEKLPRKERDFLSNFQGSDIITREFFLRSSSLKDSEYSVYRNRLLARGILVSPNRGELKMALPRFGIFSKRKKEEELGD